MGKWGRARAGFVFSLDAFVAFSLVLIAIQSFVVISSAPSGYYLPLKQANYLAEGALNVLSEPKFNNGKETLFDNVAYDSKISSLGVESYSQSTQNLIAYTAQLIPAPYSFSYEYYDFKTGWHTLYNASSHPAGVSRFYWPRFSGVKFNRVQASASTLIGVYSDPLLVGDSPYCNVMCKGYDKAASITARSTRYRSAESCTQTPCTPMPGSNFDAGDFNVGILRLTVWG